MAFANAFNENGGTATTDSTKQVDLSAQCNGERVAFTTPDKFVSSTVKVYFNGLRQFVNDGFTLSNNNTITTTFTPDNGDNLFVDYQIL